MDRRMSEMSGERMASGPASQTDAVDTYGHLRKSSPATEPLRRTLSWFANLPPEVQPFVLLRRYARVANLIAATWHDPHLFQTYMESLLIDRRGGRRGFPPNVRRELLLLQKHRESRRSKQGDSPPTTARGAHTRAGRSRSNWRSDAGRE
jgi:hypothetical protein